MTTLAEAIEPLIAALDELSIPFVIGGSIASGFHVMPRQTNDVDIVIALRKSDAAVLCRKLAAEFYLDEDYAIEALQAGRPFNAIHMKGAFKFDFFPAHDLFSESELTRRRYPISVIPGLDKLEVPVISPEDTVLSKMAWFRRGGEVSDRQWHDILGVLSVQKGRLDQNYLEQWALRLGVSDLLRKALSESGAST